MGIGRSGGLLAMGVMLAATLLPATDASACNTPVYRYALYRWQPAPYELYYLHSGEQTAEAAGLNAAIVTRIESQAAPLNLAFAPIDVAADAELAALPPEVRKQWLAGKTDLPGYLLVSPEGRELYRGPLAVGDWPRLFESLARRSLAEQLAAGRAGVFLLLTSKDETANAAAEQTLRQLLADVADGKVELYTPDEAEAGELAKEGADAAKSAPPLEVGLLRVDRSDPAEVWLVKQLLAVEEDLAGRDEPMVFACFGRGRVLPPYVGRGVHYENLRDGLLYVTGACACTVREQNPGFELLMGHDWDEAATRLAKQFTSDEGADFAVRDLQIFPDLVPKSPPVDGASTWKPTPPRGSDPSEQEAQRVIDISKLVAPPSSDAPREGGDVPADASEPAGSVSVAAKDDPANASRTMYLAMGLGLFGVCLILAGVTWWNFSSR